MKKIVILDSVCAKQNDLDFEKLSTIGEVREYVRTAPSDVIERIGDAEIVVTNKVPITGQIIDCCPNVKFITVLATGYNIIDTQYAKENGIIVSNVPAYSTTSVVQHTFALLLSIANRICEHNSAVKEGEWSSHPDFCLYKGNMIELSGKTLGIIGYGSIGKKVAEAAKAFGMKTVFHTRTPIDENLTSEQVFRCSDIISLHCPLNDKNVNMINKDSIEMMKNGVIIINTARGGLVNEYDVAEALDSGKIGYYAADVLTEEPPLKSNPLINHKHAIITSHIAWATKEARERLINATFENINSYINGTPINVVNK